MNFILKSNIAFEQVQLTQKFVPCEFEDELIKHAIKVNKQATHKKITLRI